MRYFAFQWHITDYCDQRCKHCYIFSEDEIETLEMPFEKMVKVVESCEEMCEKINRKPYFYITGGDPILHSGFWRLLKILKEKNIPFTILGNPFHLDDEVCLRLKDLGCEKYQMSIDGLRKTHDYIRQEGSFDETVEKIKSINKAGIKSVIMATVSGLNIAEIPAIIDLVVENNVDIFAFSRYCPTSQEKDVNIKPLEYRALLNKCYAKFQEYKDSKTYFNMKDHLWKLYLYEEGVFEIDESLDKSLIYDGCHCGESHFTILPNGDLYACRRMESKVGNIFKKEIYDVWTGREMDEYRQYNDFVKCSKCELLRFCRGCPAVSYGTTGNMYQADPQCWKEI